MNRFMDGKYVRRYPVVYPFIGFVPVEIAFDIFGVFIRRIDILPFPYTYIIYTMN